MDSNKVNSEPVVSVNEGKLAGKTDTDFNGNTYYSFQGIPYAEPPLGILRFKAPQPAKSWSGIKYATKESDDCFQTSMVTNLLEGSEDCLYLNVYTPQLPSAQQSKLKPVMVWIHGGAFTSGSGSTLVYGPEYLVAEDIVLVTINYRLGVLGFLTLQDPSLGVPGNAGMKDQVMALKWVKRNIKQFNGDPENITIFGESAGGASVEYLMLSPMAKGLFHKAIAQSGSALNCWSRAKNILMMFTELLGIESNDENVILKCLQEVPVEELNEKSQKLRDRYFLGDSRPFGLVIEKPSNEPAFLSEEPINILKSGKYTSVPMIMGFTSREGMYIYSMLAEKPHNLLKDESLIPHTWNIRKGTPLYKQIFNRIKDFYGFNTDLEKIDKDNIYRVYTHTFFSIDMYNSALYHMVNSKDPVYFYIFDVDAELNMLKIACEVKEKGACHSDELAYLFKPSFMDLPEKDSVEYKIIKKMTKLWTNFAKYSCPTPSKDPLLMNTIWKPVTQETFNYLNISNTDLKLERDPERRERDFWNKLYSTKDVLYSKF